MDASRYVAVLHEHLANVSALADEPTKEVVQQLGTSVESAFQLALLQALTDAAAQLSAELAPLAVQVRLDGTDPEFMVQRPPAGDAGASSAEGLHFDVVDADLRDEEDDGDNEDDFLGEADEGPARISLRLPAVVKRRIDQAADEERVSTNAWIVRAVISQLPRRPRSDVRQERRGRRGQRRGGWNDAFGPGGQFRGGHGGPFGGTPRPR